jgi:glycine/D-amino acid oxidase-like deaminating enzyme
MIVDVDVAVIGAGPTGLMLAGDLARAGVSCVVFERRPERSGLTRAFAVHARTLEQLDARGVADPLVATGTPVRAARFLAGAELDLSRLPSRFPYVLITPQYETERVLAAEPARWEPTSGSAPRSPGSPSPRTGWRRRSARTASRSIWCARARWSAQTGCAVPSARPWACRFPVSRSSGR